MKKELVPVFIARDKTRFTNESECLAYEREHLPKMLAALTEAQVSAALSREDTELADLIEEAGRRIMATRRG